MKELFLSANTFKLKRSIFHAKFTACFNLKLIVKSVHVGPESWYMYYRISC